MDEPNAAPAASAAYSGLSEQFESGTRWLRWLCIATVAAFFPYGAAYEPYIFILVAAGTLYNVTRYITPLLKLRFYGSPLAVLILDNLFVGALLALLGNINTAFSAFLVFMVVTAAFRYRLVGAAAVALSQGLWLYVVGSAHWFPPAALSRPVTVLVIMAVLVGLGLLIDRLTYIDREERAMLKAFNAKTDTERSHLLALVNVLTNAIFVVNSRGKIVLYNDAATWLVGKDEPIRGRSFNEVFRLHNRNAADAKVVNLLTGDMSPQRRRDLCVTTPDGQTVDLDITVHAVQLESMDMTDYIIVCEDITRERSLDEQRSEFIAVASHELRTPIAIMEAALSTALISKNLPSETRTLMEQAHSNSALLAGIIKDLSTLAQAKNDNIPVQIENLDAKALLEQLVDGFKPQAEQKGLALRLEVDPKTPQVLTTERHVREILQNYLNNALKYTLGGEVRLLAQPAKNGGVLFSVVDSGIGISPTDQKHLFTKFFRVEDYRTRTTGGSGLGLYLCRELADRIGGKVWCESALNKGSSFYLQVPPFSGQTRDQGEVVKAQVANLVEGL